MNTNRRAFLKQTGVGMAAAYLAPSLFSCAPRRTSSQAGTGIGLQLYTLRDQLAAHVQQTITRVAEIGYNHVETFGPEFDAKGKASFWGMNVADLTALLDKSGLNTHSGHYDLTEFLAPGNGDESVLKNAIDVAAQLGQQYLIAPVPPMQLVDQLTADDYLFIAEQLNRGGELAAKSGVKIGYHNHFWEFRMLEDGRKGLDILIEHTDKDLVVFELDLFWSEKSGSDSTAYFGRYPGRFPLWHIKDMDTDNTEPVTGPGYDDKPVMDIVTSISYAEVGTGSIDFKKLMAESGTAGLRYAFVEQDVITIDPFDSVAKSYGYVKQELLP
ncbi:sugar phosphate isomerase/epimerase family protein [Parapedobacter composti]|nr:sugar phosphate isomerase/epimerase [Parapedobacter composti]